MSQQSIPARPRRAEARQRIASQRRKQNLMLIGAGAFFVLLIAGVIGMQIWANRPVAGEESFPSQGNIHIQTFGAPSPIAYNSTPPTSGPHYDNLAGWGVHDQPIRYEQLNHNLEDGGVIIYYQCPEGCPEMVEELRNLLQPYLNQAESHVVLTPNDPTWTADGTTPAHKDMGHKIAVVAWERLLLLDEVDTERIRLFIEKYRGRDHHVAGIG